jgi:hypothetical protein
VMPVLSTNTMQRDTVADRITSRVAAASWRPHLPDWDVPTDRSVLPTQSEEEHGPW